MKDSLLTGRNVRQNQARGGVAICRDLLGWVFVFHIMLLCFLIV